VKSSARVLRQLGIDVSTIAEAGGAGYRQTAHVARRTFALRQLRHDCALDARILAGQQFPATLTGDASLRRRRCAG